MPHPSDTEDAETRRVFVKQIAFGGGLVLLGGGAGCREGAKDKGAPPPSTPAHPELTHSHRTFTDAEWLTLIAAVDRMLPADEDPGALDARVPVYIDRILQTPQLAQMRDNFVPGVAALDRRAQRMFKVPFAQATPAQQDELLAIFKNSAEKSGEARWYEILLTLTLEGFLGDPSYGGNQGEVGWKLVGFQLIGRNVKGDPPTSYDGRQNLDRLTCGGGHGC